MEHDVYTSNLAAIGYRQERMVSDGGDARHQIVVEEASVSTLSATATCTIDFDEDGVLKLWHIDQEGHLTEGVPD